MYDDTLDPISPNFDPESWGDGPAEGGVTPLLESERPGFEREDTPMIDEQGPLVAHPDRVRDLIAFHTTQAANTERNPKASRIPVSITYAERLSLKLRGRRVDPIKALRVRLLAGYPALTQSDFEKRA